MRRSLLLAAASTLIIPLTSVAGIVSAGTAGAASPAAQGKQSMAIGTGGAVASESLAATQAGINALKHGGNAIDAAVATATTMGVTEPDVAGPGGGGYMVIYLAKTHQVVTIEGREKCPVKCTPSLFVNKRTGNPYTFEYARHSGISVGVPGLVQQWAVASRLYGNHSFAQNLQPAIRTAYKGFTINENFHQSQVNALTDLRAFSSTRKLFLRNGQPLPVGYHFRNPQLGRTYSKLAQYGPQYLYDGPLGAQVARTVRNPPQTPNNGISVIPGIMTRQDLANYTAPVQAPTHVSYRGLDVYGMAPSSSGGITMGEALNILSGFPMSSEARSAALYQYLEASRLAFADRNAYIGDTSYENVPVQQLLSKKFAASRRCLIKGTALTSPAAPGNPYDPASCSSTGTAAPTTREGTQTNHIVTSDKWGNVVSYTNTIEQLWGSGITVPGAGFVLNNEMTDFDFAPSAPPTHDPNLPSPGKRPRSSMSPTIVLKGGQPYLAVGSPGGSTIITTTLQTLINYVDFGMTLPQAIAAPRASQRNATTTDVEPAFAQQPYATVLRNKYGEDLAVVGPPNYVPPVIGFVNAIAFPGHGVMQAATEPVRLGGGSAMVVNPSG